MKDVLVRIKPSDGHDERVAGEPTADLGEGFRSAYPPSPDDGDGDPRENFGRIEAFNSKGTKGERIRGPRARIGFEWDGSIA